MSLAKQSLKSMTSNFVFKVQHLQDEEERANT